eukprot:tig00000889_g5334.t1
MAEAWGDGPGAMQGAPAAHVSPAPAAAAAASGSKKRLLIIDGAYLEQCLERHYKIPREEFDWIAFRKLLEHLCKGSFYERLYFTASPDRPDAKENFRRFENLLSRAPPDGPQFRVSRHRMKAKSVFCRHCKQQTQGQEQAGVDVGIAVALVKACFQGKADEVALLTGDVDFEDAVTVASDLGKTTVLLGFRNNTVSSTLQSFVSEVHWLDEHITKGMRRDRAGGQSNRPAPQWRGANGPQAGPSGSGSGSGGSSSAPSYDRPPLPRGRSRSPSPSERPKWDCPSCTRPGRPRRPARRRCRAGAAAGAPAVIDLSEDDDDGGGGPGHDPPSQLAGRRPGGALAVGAAGAGGGLGLACPSCMFEREGPASECPACGFVPLLAPRAPFP